MPSTLLWTANISLTKLPLSLGRLAAAAATGALPINWPTRSTQRGSARAKPSRASDWNHSIKSLAGQRLARESGVASMDGRAAGLRADRPRRSMAVARERASARQWSRPLRELRSRLGRRRRQLKQRALLARTGTATALSRMIGRMSGGERFKSHNMNT